MVTLKSLPINAESTGLTGENSADCKESVANEFGLSKSEIQELNALWSIAYCRELSIRETLEIYNTVKHFVEVIA